MKLYIYRGSQIRYNYDSPAQPGDLGPHRSHTTISSLPEPQRTQAEEKLKLLTEPGHTVEYDVRAAAPIHLEDRLHLAAGHKFPNLVIL